MQTDTATPRADFSLFALRLFWCSDCQTDALFESTPAVNVDSAPDWACTACGAAYFDALDTIAEPTREPIRTFA